MKWTEGTPDASWDAPLFAAGGHFLQSTHWAAFQAAMGRKLWHATGEDWQCLAIFESSRTGSRLYCPYGPVAQNKRAFNAALAALRDLAKQTHAVFVRMEPAVPLTEKDLPAFGLKPAFKDIQQHLTWVQDLTKPDEDLWADMTPTNRNLFRNFASKGLSLRASTVPTDMAFFITLMRQVAAHNSIVQHDDHYYQTMADVLLTRGAAKLYLAEHEGKVVASAFCFDSPTTRYYAHAAADFEARRLHPGTPLLAQMIFDAKAAGQTQFDFMGVAPATAPANHKWMGFTKFKQSFGGDYKPYLGTWELGVQPLPYALYRGAYKAKKILKPN